MHVCRVSHEPGFLDLVDVVGRGGSDDWRALYERVRDDRALRAEVRAALPQVDPELGSARELWGLVLDGLDRHDAEA